MFIQAIERYGRSDFESISKHIGISKTIDEIKKYSDVFWERINDFPEGQKIVKMVERGEKNIKERANNILLVNLF